MKKSKGNLASRPRLSDVASVAGVSLGAASKALSAPDAVRPATLRAVRRAVETLGYIPSGAARALASRSTRMVGVVLPTINNPVYATFVHELQKTLARQGLHLLALAHEYDRESEIRLIERLVSRSVDALIMIGTDHDDRTTSLLKKIGMPHIHCWSSDKAPRQGALGFNNQAAMIKVVDHLADLGHKRIAMIGGETWNNERAQWRLRGVQKAAAAHKMDLVKVATVPLTIAGGQIGYDQIDPVRNKITALICGTDLQAAGALHAARAGGVALPDQLSITGFDDIEMAALLSPALTTIRAPIAELAVTTGNAIIGMLQGEGIPKSLSLPTELIVRQSTGRAPV
ncbi:LacI family DNA-binding transcriptional regulator [Bradyrhizobium vignae]|nr:substrate-binding domain-containing protein [Bradyrhizobium vignae]